jgi:hypothetical protein
VDLYPAIDLRGGRCVRLYQGDFGRETAYGTDPVAVAELFAGAGARWIHVVDLETLSPPSPPPWHRASRCRRVGGCATTPPPGPCGRRA